MAADHGKEPMQKTPTGHEIPVPTKREVDEFFKGVTGKRPSTPEPKHDDSHDAAQE